MAASTLEAPGHGRRRRGAVGPPAVGTLLLAALPLLGGAALGAGAFPPRDQELARPRLEGRVVRSPGDTVGVLEATVVLHLVTPDTAGEIATTRSGPGGAFAFDLPTVPDPVGRGDVYFASVDHQGILYFGPAIHQAVQLDTPYLIEVHDTIVAPPEGYALPIEIRYVVLQPEEDGWWVTDLFQVENPGETTIVAAEDGVIWSYPLAAGAWSVEVGASDVPSDAIVVKDGVLRVSAPIPPGTRQYMVRYRLEDLRLDLSLPGRVHQLELLVPEPAPPLSVQGLMANPSVEMQPGVTYRRFSAMDLQDGRVIVLPGLESWAMPMEWMAVILTLILAAGALWAVQRRPAPAAAPGSPADSPPPLSRPGAASAPAGVPEARERLLLEVASVDERLEGALEEEERREITEQRRALMERLHSL